MQNWNQWPVPTGTMSTAMPQPPTGYSAPGTDPMATMQAYMQYYNQPAPSGYTAEQWAAAQQQNWAQWQQWQQQYQQWQAQYGEKYQETMKQYGQHAPPLPLTSQPPPPPPKDDKPPLPPSSVSAYGYSTAPPPPPSGNSGVKRPAGSEVEADSAKKLKETDEELSEAEKTFDAQFKQWEEKFNTWKLQNANHPDKTQYKQYEAKWTSWREKLIERREQMRRKREQQKLAAAAKADSEKKDLSGGDKILNILSSTENQGHINNLLGIGKSLGLTSKQDQMAATTTTAHALPAISMQQPTAMVTPQVSMTPMMQPADMTQAWAQWGQYTQPMTTPMTNTMSQYGMPPPMTIAPPAQPNFSQPPPGFPPANFSQPPPGFSQPPPSLNTNPPPPPLSHPPQGSNYNQNNFNQPLNQLRGPPPIDNKNPNRFNAPPPQVNFNNQSNNFNSVGNRNNNFNQGNINANKGNMAVNQGNIGIPLGNHGNMGGNQGNRSDFNAGNNNQNRSGGQNKGGNFGTNDNYNDNFNDEKDDFGNNKFGNRPPTKNQSVSEDLMPPELKELMAKRNAAMDVFKPSSSFGGDQSSKGSLSESFKKVDKFGNFSRGSGGYDSSDNISSDNQRGRFGPRGLQDFEQNSQDFDSRGPHDFDNEGPNFRNRGMNSFGKDGKGQNFGNRGPNDFNNDGMSFGMRGSNNFGNDGPNFGNRGLNNCGKDGSNFGNRGQNDFANDGPNFGNRGPNNFGNDGPNFGNRGPNDFGNDGPNFGNRGPNDFGPNFGNRGPNFGNRGPNNFNNDGPNNFGNRGPNNFGNDGPNFGSRGPNDFGPNFGNRGPNNFSNRGPNNFNNDGPNNFGNRGPNNFGNDGPNFGNRGPNDFGPNFGNRGPNNFSNRGPNNFNNDGVSNFGNRGPNNFVNRGSSNFDSDGPSFRKMGQNDFGNDGPSFGNRGPHDFANTGPNLGSRCPNEFGNEPNVVNRGPNNFGNKLPNAFENNSPLEFSKGPNKKGKNKKGNQDKSSASKDSDNVTGQRGNAAASSIGSKGSNQSDKAELCQDTSHDNKDSDVSDNKQNLEVNQSESLETTNKSVIDENKIGEQTANPILDDLAWIPCDNEPNNEETNRGLKTEIEKSPDTISEAPEQQDLKQKKEEQQSTSDSLPFMGEEDPIAKDLNVQPPPEQPNVAIITTLEEPPAPSFSDDINLDDTNDFIQPTTAGPENFEEPVTEENKFPQFDSENFNSTQISFGPHEAGNKSSLGHPSTPKSIPSLLDLKIAPPPTMKIPSRSNYSDDDTQIDSEKCEDSFNETIDNNQQFGPGGPGPFGPNRLPFGEGPHDMDRNFRPGGPGSYGPNRPPFSNDGPMDIDRNFAAGGPGPFGPNRAPFGRDGPQDVDRNFGPGPFGSNRLPFNNDGPRDVDRNYGQGPFGPNRPPYGNDGPIDMDRNFASSGSSPFGPNRPSFGRDGSHDMDRNFGSGGLGPFGPNRPPFDNDGSHDLDFGPHRSPFGNDNKSTDKNLTLDNDEVSGPSAANDLNDKQVGLLGAGPGSINSAPGILGPAPGFMQFSQPTDTPNKTFETGDDSNVDTTKLLPEDSQVDINRKSSEEIVKDSSNNMSQTQDTGIVDPDVLMDVDDRTVDPEVSSFDDDQSESGPKQKSSPFDRLGPPFDRPGSSFDNVGGSFDRSGSFDRPGGAAFEKHGKFGQSPRNAMNDDFRDIAPEFHVGKQFNYNHGGTPKNPNEFIAPTKIIDYAHEKKSVVSEFVEPIFAYDYGHGKIHPNTSNLNADFKNWEENEQNLSEYHEEMKKRSEKKGKVWTASPPRLMNTMLWDETRSLNSDNLEKGDAREIERDRDDRRKDKDERREMDKDERLHDRSRDKDRDRDRDKNRNKDRSRDKDRDDRHNDRIRSEKDRDDRHREMERYSERSHDRDRDYRHRSSDRDRSRDKDRDRERDRDRDREERYKDRDDRYKDREDRYKDRDDRHKDRSYDKDRSHDKEREDRHKDRGHDKDREDRYKERSDKDTKERTSDKDRDEKNEKDKDMRVKLDKSPDKKDEDIIAGEKSSSPEKTKEADDKDKPRELEKNEDRSKGSVSWQDSTANIPTDTTPLQESSLPEIKQNVLDIAPKIMELPKTPNLTMVDDLLCSPSRLTRPPKIAIILRGPPGSGKSFVAKLIKDKEVAQGGSAPRILSIDDYFLVEKDSIPGDDKADEMEYKYEEAMEPEYFNHLIKAFKKNVTDGFFNFIILDSINEKISDYEEMWSFAKTKGFKVYVCEMEMDVQICLKRNIHKRLEDEINRIVDYFEPSPSHHHKLDVTSLLQEQAIEDVEMEDVQETSKDEDKEKEKEKEGEHVNDDSQDSQEDTEITAISKWEKMEAEDKLDRLDGLKRKDANKPQTMEDFLQVPDYYDVEDDSGKKRVRWADLEERKEQEKMRAVGFVVGQTNWNRMMDPTHGSSALTRTKYI